MVETLLDRLPAEDTGFRFARRMAAMSQSGLRDLMSRASRPGVLSFAVGLPAAELFPVHDLALASARVLPADAGALQYAVPYVPLKRQIVELMAARGVACRPEQVFLTSGSQQAMDLLARLFLDPGGEVMLEETVYDGAQMAVKLLTPSIITLPTGPTQGLDVAAAGRLLAGGARPAFLYTIPSGHNPLGVSLAPERRRALVELARSFRLPILEDDAYGFLEYDEPSPPPLRALDERWVLYLGSFSKILAPGLRAGWIVVPEELVPRLSALKHATDLDTPSLSHWLISAYLESRGLAAHLDLLRREYRRRRDAMLTALAACFPPEVRWNRPAGGMFVWVELPAGADATALLELALATESVAFTPGVAFAVAGGRHAAHCLRLCFTALPGERIEAGIRRLARAVAAYLGQLSRTA
ncbi:MAG TPA: PLP-dependent aminotransferase family protein [Thermoanaerobaculia bacterium]|nr:PLP-dependent aminotransferase family protein [Thermoanaerobaculia bacterium]